MTPTANAAAASGQPLAQRGILVTRPAHQAQRLIELIRAAGGNPIVFPVLEILDVADTRPLLALIDRLDQFDLAIFISPNAVAKAMGLITARRALPATLQIAAVGRGSAGELKRHGCAAVIAPQAGADSEALLALPELQDMCGRSVVIFRGDGGRELLGDILTARGARLEYAECYRRRKPDADASDLLRAWERNELHAVTVSSSEGVHNLLDMVGEPGRQRLRETPVFAPHPRIAQAARDLGLPHVVQTEMGDEGLVAGLCQWFARHP